ncbi:MAG TPA: flagellar motor switch protein FliN, partial [bacterium]|nr:flagellar motor switch protein FliN [bacterium]
KDVAQNAKEPAAKKAAAPAAAAAPASAAPAAASGDQIDINYLLDVNLEVTVEVGRRQVYISQLLSWSPGSIVELDKLVGQPLNLLVNNKAVATGEVVVLNDKFAIKITSVMDPDQRMMHLSQ